MAPSLPRRVQTFSILLHSIPPTSQMINMIGSQSSVVTVATLCPSCLHDRRETGAIHRGALQSLTGPDRVCAFSVITHVAKMCVSDCGSVCVFSLLPYWLSASRRRVPVSRRHPRTLLLCVGVRVRGCVWVFESARGLLV